MKNKNILFDLNKLNTYVDQVGYKKDNVLSELRSITESLGDVSIMQIGQTQGALIQMLCTVVILQNVLKLVYLRAIAQFASQRVCRKMENYMH